MKISHRKLRTKLQRIQTLYKIKDKNKQIIPFKLNTAQWQIVADIAHQHPIRHFTLKSRQVGVTTFWLIWNLDDCIFEDNVTTGILAHKWESLIHLWSIVDLAYNTFPEKLPLKKESAKAYEFAHNNSKIFISLSIRSIALHNLHISEWCFCRDDEIKATLGACSPATNISGESTGNGVSNDGYQTYMDARMGTNEYKPRFIAWFLHKEYRLPLNGIEPDQIMGDLSDSEKKLKSAMKKDYNLELEPEQVLFRRQRKKALKDLFPQEFPESEEDAFITSGEHFFNLKKAIALLKEAKEWHKERNYHEKGTNYVCFEPPNNHSDFYVAGADTAEGTHDHSVLKIINVTKRKEAFVLKGKIGIKQFYRDCDYWCRQYNNALLAVEDNNTGHAVLLGLEENCRYPNLYKESNVTRIVKDSSKIRLKLGWHTDKFSRVQMLNDLKYAIEDDDELDEVDFAPEVIFYDVLLLTELFDFVKIDKKYEAAEGKLDDDIIATSIAMQLYLKYKIRDRSQNIKKAVILGKQREFKV